MVATRRFHQIDWRVYVILDPTVLPEGRALKDVALAAIRGGAGVLQLRDKTATSRELWEMSRVLSDLCRAQGALLVVNDRLDVALAAGADGVHLGPDDLPLAEARRLAPDLVIGGSAGTLDRAQDLVALGADYLGVGAIFEARPLKPNASPPRGTTILREVTAAMDVPVVGIGGITEATADQVAAAGAAGVAVIRAVVGDDNPEAATRALRLAVDRGRQSR